MTPRVRTVVAAYPSAKSADGCPLCVVCGEELRKLDGQPRHGLARYCSDGCTTEAYVKAGSAQVVRWELEKRDKGICAACGLDCLRVKALFRRLGWRGSGLGRDLLYMEVPHHLGPALAEARRLADEIGSAAAARLRLLGWNQDAHTWEADHVVAVAEGGGGCGLDGYQTLCRRCHKSETKALRGRLAAARRSGGLKIQMDLFTEVGSVIHSRETPSLGEKVLDGPNKSG